MLIDIPMYNVMCLYNEIVIHCVVLDFHFQAFTIQFGLKRVKKVETSASTYLIKFFEVYEDKSIP